MEQTKKEWRIGFAYFCGLVAALYFGLTTMPNGQTLLNGFLGIFGLGGGLTWGNATFEPMPFIVLGLIVFCSIRCWRLWRGYFERYYHSIRRPLYFLPMIIGFVAILLSNMFITPSFIDRLYFSAMSNREGVHAVSVGESINVRYAVTNLRTQTFSYEFTLYNHGSDYVQFYVIYEYRDNPNPRNELQRGMILNEEGQAKLFELAPTSWMPFVGEFVVESPEVIVHMSAGLWVTDLILVVDGDEYKPSPLVRSQWMIWRR